MKDDIRLVDINRVKNKIFASRQYSFTRNELEYFFSKKEAPTINLNDFWPTATWLTHLEYCKKHDYHYSGINPKWWCSNCECGFNDKSNYCPECGYKMTISKDGIKEHDESLKTI